MPDLPWNKIKTVLLDMDGTLLDLHYDSHFWLEHLPKKYAGIKGISEEQGKEYMMAEYRQVFGTIDWYCLVCVTTPFHSLMPLRIQGER